MHLDTSADRMPTVREIDNHAVSRRTFLKATAGVGFGLAISAALGPIDVLAGGRPTPTQDLHDRHIRASTTADQRVYNPGEIVRHGDQTVPDVFLTFDDDWRNVPQILDIARQKQARITFFPVGQAMRGNSSLWQEVLLEGHTVENHTWDHKNLNKLTPDQVRDEITRQRDLVEEIASEAGVLDPSGKPYREVFLRGPGGRTNSTVQGIAKDLGLVIARWTISSAGTSPNASDYTVYHHVVDRLDNGVIVLQHAKIHDVNVLPDIIDETRRQGFHVEKSLRDGIPTSIYP